MYELMNRTDTIILSRRQRAKVDGDLDREACGQYQFSRAEKIARELEVEATRLVGKYRAGSVSHMFLSLHLEAGMELKPELEYDTESGNIHMIFGYSKILRILISPRDLFQWISYGDLPMKSSEKNWLQQFTPEMIEAARRVS